jgi:F-type H+-transporting ATPase subunit k
VGTEIVLTSTILGRAIKTEYLALGTLLSTVGLSYAAASGGSKSAPSGSKQTIQEVKDSVKFESSSKWVFSSLLPSLLVTRPSVLT